MQGGMFKEHWPGGLLYQSRWRRKKRKKITRTSKAAQHSTIKKEQDMEYHFEFIKEVKEKYEIVRTLKNKLGCLVGFSNEQSKAS